MSAQYITTAYILILTACHKHCNHIHMIVKEVS